MRSSSSKVILSRLVWIVPLMLVGLAPGYLPAQSEKVASTNAVAVISHRERVLMEAWHQEVDPKAMPVENMTVPIAHHPNGSVRALLKAGRALIPATDSGYVRAQDVVIELYDMARVLEGIFIADNCFYDRATAAGYCDGKVRIERKGVHVKGVNMVWNLNDHSAKILTQPEVRFDRFIDGMGDLFK